MSKFNPFDPANGYSEEDRVALETKCASLINRAYRNPFPGASLRHDGADNAGIFFAKAYVNSCRCTPNEIIEATKIIFGATEVVYSERRDVPATIYLSISAPFSDLVLSILGTHDLVVHPAGVRVRINCSTEDAETFGFVDLNPRVAGFGEGMFAQSIN